MKSVPDWLRRADFLSAATVTFGERGFAAASEAARRRLETVAQTVVAGYEMALEAEPDGDLAGLLDGVEAERRGFAYEGAAMALTLLHGRRPQGRHAEGRQRLLAFLDGPARRYPIPVHCGVGMARRVLGRRLDALAEELDPLLRWFTMDGFGFSHGFFNGEEGLAAAGATELEGYARRTFDQGLGRSLWFVYGAGVEGVAEAISRSEEPRRPDLWSGVGFACSYAGIADPEELAALARESGAHRSSLALGAAIAGAARRRGGNPAPHTDAACRLLCRLSPDEAADLATAAGESLRGAAAGAVTAGAAAGEPAHALWRRRIREGLPAAASAP